MELSAVGSRHRPGPGTRRLDCLILSHSVKENTGMGCGSYRLNLIHRETPVVVEFISAIQISINNFNFENDTQGLTKRMGQRGKQVLFQKRKSVVEHSLHQSTREM